jgi:hypothetical protein
MERWTVKVITALVAALALALLPARVSATWSILVFDPATGRVIIASATCAVPGADNLKLVQAVVIPGVGVGANQSSVDGTQANHKLMYEELLKGTHPDSIILLMEKADSARIESRQIGIVDVKGRASGRSGSGNSSVAMDIQGRAPDGLVYSVQGNIIASEAALTETARVLQETPGDAIDRVMLAMEKANSLGGDRRCTCEGGSGGPIPGLPCNGRTAVTAYILVADPTDSRGRYAEYHPQIPGRVRGDPSNTRAPWNDGDYYLYLAAYPSNTVAGEDSSPVRTLRMRYDAWKAKGKPRMNMAAPSPNLSPGAQRP